MSADAEALATLEAEARRRGESLSAVHGRGRRGEGRDDLERCHELRSRASEAEVMGVEVAVCSAADLRAMKRAAGRPRDLVDLEDLEAAGG